MNNMLLSRSIWHDMKGPLAESWFTDVVFVFSDGEKQSPLSPVFNPPRLKFPKHITNPMDDKFEVSKLLWFG